MGKVTILEWTTKNPLQQIGYNAGVCWGANVDDKEKNIKRAKECISNDHGRTTEFPDVNMVLDGYSARVIREWYTHIGGMPTRLQSSTRYVKWAGRFDENFVMAPKIKEALDKDPGLRHNYEEFKKSFQALLDDLEAVGVPKEDAALFYPLGMTTKITCKHNMRNLVDMSHQRMCSRAYHEYRKLFKDVLNALHDYSDEWAWIVDNCMKSKCELLGYCPEKFTCGRKPSIVEKENEIQNLKNQIAPAGSEQMYLIQEADNMKAELDTLKNN